MTSFVVVDSAGRTRACAGGCANPDCGFFAIGTSDATREAVEEDLRLLRCSGCNEAQYCGQKCQKLHWSQHKDTCKVAAGFLKASALMTRHPDVNAMIKSMSVDPKTAPGRRLIYFRCRSRAELKQLGDVASLGSASVDVQYIPVAALEENVSRMRNDGLEYMPWETALELTQTYADGRAAAVAISCPGSDGGLKMKSFNVPFESPDAMAVTAAMDTSEVD